MSRTKAVENSNKSVKREAPEIRVADTRRARGGDYQTSLSAASMQRPLARHDRPPLDQTVGVSVIVTLCNLGDTRSGSRIGTPMPQALSN
jgi:hypothetical protein